MNIEQITPETQEWSAETVMAIAKSEFAHEACERVASQHNSIIKAACEKAYRQGKHDQLSYDKTVDEMLAQEP